MMLCLFKVGSLCLHDNGRIHCCYYVLSALEVSENFDTVIGQVSYFGKPLFFVNN